MAKRTRKTILSRLKSIECTLQGIIDACSEPVSLFTAFTVNLETDQCAGSAETYPVTYYHNGEGEYPILGDTIFSDVDGLMPVAGGNFVMSAPSGVGTDLNGVSIVVNCL